MVCSFRLQIGMKQHDTSFRFIPIYTKNFTERVSVNPRSPELF